MSFFKDTRILPYEAKLINDIVLDIEKYPEFLPWCSSTKVISRREKEIIAEMSIGFSLFHENYVSRIITDETSEGFTINVEAISGPFEKLVNFWHIAKKDDPENNHSEVNFSVDFELKSAILGAVMESFFSVATNKMINAFEARALYLSTLNKT